MMRKPKQMVMNYIILVRIYSGRFETVSVPQNITKTYMFTIRTWEPPLLFDNLLFAVIYLFYLYFASKTL